MKNAVITSLILLVFLSSCKNQKKAKDTSIYIDLVEQSMDENGSVKAVDKDGNEVELKVLTEKELQQKHKEFEEKYPDML